MKRIFFISMFLILFSGFACAGVVLNEIMPGQSAYSGEWIEVHNNGTESVNLTGWYITEESPAGNTYIAFTFDKIISPNDYLIANWSGFRLNDAGDNVTLWNSSDNVIDNHVYANAVAGHSYGRMHNGLGTWVEFDADDTTKNSANNRKPIISSIADVSFYEDLNYTYQVSVNDLDGDSLSYSLTGPNGMSINQSGYIEWNGIDNDNVGKYNISIFVNDGYGAVNETFELEVVNVNDAPVFTNAVNALLTGVEGVLYSFDFDAVDIDPTNDTLTFSLVNGLTGMSIYSSTGYFTWRPADSGEYNYNVSVSDGNNGFDYYNVNVSVDNALDFLNFKVNDVSLSDGGNTSIAPGDVVEIEMVVENNMDIDINQINISAELDGGAYYSANSTIPLFGLDEMSTKTKIITFKIPYNAVGRVYDLNVVLSGVDDNGYLRSADYHYVLNLVKENHLLRIDGLSLSNNNLSCYRHAILDVDVLNIGGSYEDSIKVEVDNSVLGIDFEQTLNNLAKEESHILSFDIGIDSEITGVYPLIVKVSSSDSSLVSDSVDLKLSECVSDRTINEDGDGFTITLPVGYDYNEINQTNKSLISCSFGADIICSAPVNNGYGQSNINFSASKDGFTYYNTFSIYVLSDNDALVLSGLPQDSTINEDSTGVFDFSSYVSDIDDDVFYWSYSAENISISFNGNIGTISGKPNWHGSELVNISVSDGEFIDSEMMLITVLGIDDISVINSYNPFINPVLGADEKMNFSVSASDIDSDMAYNWLLTKDGGAGNPVGSLSSYLLDASEHEAGDYNLTVLVDGTGHEWKVKITDVPIALTFDGSTTDFSSVNDLTNVSSVILEKSAYGKIEFNESLNLTGVWDLDNYVVVGSNIIAVNTTKYPNLNKPAIITMKGLSYSEVPRIYYNPGFVTDTNLINTECDFCSLLNYTSYPTTNGEVRFYAEHFSSFKIGFVEVLNYSGLDTCSLGEIGDLEVSIEEPDDDEEYGPGDAINLEIEVKNKGDKDKDVKVVAVLYDVTDNDVVDKESKTEEINDNDEETFEISLKIPKNADDDNEFIVYVKAYEKGNEDLHCADDEIGADIERENHKVVISDFSLMPSSVKCSAVVEGVVEIENIGSSDEEVKVILESSELGIYEESIKYELDDYNGDDENAVVRFNFKIPPDALAKTYNIIAKADYEDGSDSVTRNLEVYGCGVSVTSYGLSGLGELDLVSSVFSAKAGGSLSVPVKIRNNDDYRKTYSAGFENLGIWGKSLVGTKMINVEANSESTEYLYLRINDDAESGLHSANVKLSSAGGSDLKSISINVEAKKKALFIPKMKEDSGTLFFVLINIVLLLVVAYLFKIVLEKKRY